MMVLQSFKYVQVETVQCGIRLTDVLAELSYCHIYGCLLIFGVFYLTHDCRRVLQSYKASASSCEEIQRQSSIMSAKDYVESLHQNSKSTLLYGKNNVIVQPVSLSFALPTAETLSLSAIIS